MIVRRGKDVDVDALEYSVPKQSVMGGQTVYVELNNDPIIVQTPRCSVPFGLNVYNPLSGGPSKYSIDLSLNGNTETTSAFIEMLQKFDEKNVEQACKGAAQWFGRRVSKDTINDIYSHQLKTSDNHSPRLRVKLPTRGTDFTGDIFDHHNNAVELDAITKGCTVQAILQCVGLYFVPKEFGVTWKVLQLKVFPPQKLVQYSFVDDDDEDDAEKV